MTADAPQARPPKVLAIIPARGGSKGVPGKNIKPLAGMPLIAYTLKAALGSKALQNLVVSTDSEAIAAVCRDYGVPVPWLRPAPIAGDTTRMQDVVRHVLQVHPAGATADYLLLLQPTAPLRTTGDIDAAIRLAQTYDALSVVSVSPEETRHPYYMYRYTPPAAGHPGNIQPFIHYEPGLLRQAFPPCVFRNGAIYLVRRTYFLEHNTLVAPDAVPYLMPAERTVNIDTPEDLEYAEFLMARRSVS